jgi:hypothetical protein
LGEFEGVFGFEIAGVGFLDKIVGVGGIAREVTLIPQA